MGQYYKPVNVDNMQWLLSHDYSTGLKLMEHSWIGNEFVGYVMTLMVKGGAWYKKRIVWAGDYYDQAGETDYWTQCKDGTQLKPTITMDTSIMKTICYHRNTIAQHS